MNTAHRTASNGKHRYHADPMAIFKVMDKLTPFNDIELLRLELPIRLAFEALRTGRGTESDFHDLCAAVNTTMVRSESVDPLCEQTAIAARDALSRCLITNKGYCEPQSLALYRNIGFWRYLMPKTQALLLARAQESRRVYADHLRIQSQEWERKKALRKAKPMTLFQEAV